MNQIDPITQFRLASLGINTEEDLIASLQDFLGRVGSDLLERANLSEAQAVGIRRSLLHTPWTISNISNFLQSSPALSEEQKHNLLFMFAKVIDDAFSLGCIAHAEVSEIEAEGSTADFSAALTLQATIAQTANSDQAKERLKNIKEAIVSVVDPSVRLLDSDKFAQSIEDDVRRFLGVDVRARGYSRRTIQRAVAAILEERETGQRQS